MSEKITIDIQVTVEVTNLEGLRQLGSFVVSPAGEQPYAYVPEGDAQIVAAAYFGKLVSDAANAHPEVFREPAVKSS